VKEEHPPKGKEPIAWFLMTSEPVNTAEEADEYVGYYIQRWKIERFHYVLKSGCGIEKLQERSIEKSATLIMMYSIIAVMIMNMTYTARLTPDAPCSLLHTIKEAVDYLGRLGGPKRAPSDGPPGVKTIWIGLMKLYILLAYREYFA
jgi:hypothetical protein